MESFQAHYLEDMAYRLKTLKRMSERALAQVESEELFTTLDEVENSLAVLMKHLSGNMVHNWTRPFAADDDKPPRDRDGEFEIRPGDTRDSVFEGWEEGWSRLLEAVEGFTEADMGKKIRVRWREYTLVQALNRQLFHYSLHVGQIVFLAKHIRGAEWESLSIPRGQSEAYNERIRRERPP